MATENDPRAEGDREGHACLRADRFIHVWAYKSLDERLAIRRKLIETGEWPPGGGAYVLLTPANKIPLPASASPVQ